MKITPRFYDKVNKRMIYGAGISPAQLPLIPRIDGTFEELQGEFEVNMATGQLDANRKMIWSGDIIECDIVVPMIEGMPPSLFKARGLMKYIPDDALFRCIINIAPTLAGRMFQVTNSTVIGNGYEHAHLLKEVLGEHAASKHLT